MRPRLGERALGYETDLGAGVQGALDDVVDGVDHRVEIVGVGRDEMPAVVAHGRLEGVLHGEQAHPVRVTFCQTSSSPAAY